MTINKSLVWKMLRGAFPDEAVVITELVVDLAVKAMQISWKPEYFDAFGIEQPSSPVSDLLEAGIDALQDGTHQEGVSYYIGHARHMRRSPFVDAFVGHVPHVRVSLPEEGEFQIDTSAGIVYAGDHMLHNLPMVRQYLVDQGSTMPQLERVDLVTPARFAGARFGAVGFYLLYKKADGFPEAYILEAGMATGEPRTLYYSPGWKEPIVRRSFYQPTPGSDPKNYYRGQLSTLGGVEPYQLVIEAFAADKKTSSERAIEHGPYHTTIVTYEKVASPGIVFPALLTLQAACRVALIEQTRGRDLPDVGPVLTAILAELGKQLPWETMPGGTSLTEKLADAVETLGVALEPGRLQEVLDNDKEVT